MGSDFLKRRFFFIVVLLTVLASVIFLRDRDGASPSVDRRSTTTLDSAITQTGPGAGQPVADDADPKSRSVAAAGGGSLRPLNAAEIEGRLRDLFSGVESLEFSRSERGDIVSVLGELRKVDADPGKIQNFLIELAGAYGVPPQQIKAPSRLSGNDFSQLYTSSQIYEGFDVFGGGVQTTVNNKTGMAFLAGAFLYPVQSIDLSLQLAESEARSIIQSKFAGSGLLGILGAPSKVVYSMSDPNKAELAYVFQISLTTSKGPQVREVVVGFASRAVVYERPVSFN